MKDMSKINQVIVMLVVTVLVLLSSKSMAFDELDELQLDSVYAGRVASDKQDIITSIPFHYVGRHGRVDGEAVISPSNSNQGTASLLIQDGAQNHLSSMININAVNSPIEVLLNLVVNIDSQIGVVKQNNIRPDIRW